MRLRFCPERVQPTLLHAPKTNDVVAIEDQKCAFNQSYTLCITQHSVAHQMTQRVVNPLVWNNAQVLIGVPMIGSSSTACLRP